MNIVNSGTKKIILKHQHVGCIMYLPKIDSFLLTFYILYYVIYIIFSSIQFFYDNFLFSFFCTSYIVLLWDTCYVLFDNNFVTVESENI